QLLIKRERVDLVPLVADTVELARPLSADQGIRFERPATTLAVRGDRRRLQQVLLNLIANGLQHGASQRGLDVRVGAERDAILVQVTDYGSGIPAEHREQVFDRFYRVGAHGGGAGLGVGLFLVKAIITAHDGTIDVDSTDGHGSTFTMRLPLQLEAA
ncbi:MAG: ATP-binding protein, partial [Chloroflexi bacterium]|nr:ATP-binding protein [Chloroflexota bacterium]